MLEKFTLKKHKKIGIVAWSTGDNSFGATKPYLDFFSKYGIVTLILPQQTDIIEDLDLLVLPGGKDVSPSRYGEWPGYFTGHPDVYLEHFDTNVLGKYVNARIPIFGICRGLQTLAVFFGGSLHQHIYTPYSQQREDKVHLLSVDNKAFKNTTCFKNVFVDDKKLSVNSLHHQSVNIVPNEFVKVATTKNYGKNIEALVSVNLPIAGVQYHPEHIFDELSDQLINSLLHVNIVKSGNAETKKQEVTQF